ncbi:hypothetical protein NZNM25_01580 [Nitrosopumilus zosterae]|uniref:MFS transporter n=1 Tax=Nitrosopumilus zosterae TaxID=718286 RepID=A0A2S2KP71_9ARCH|nr:hypothetical protein [Nitrosopumilus zosterae]BDQ31154.1 hypothetical protein NZOSNM25_001265 [Nitrosopumilus zosterae]GBH33367.1 hypothetical protein NZNM25_01580 [Nitrosopumilus zosterae]
MSQNPIDPPEQIILVITTAIIDIVFSILFNEINSYASESPQALGLMIMVYGAVVTLNGLTTWFVILPLFERHH